MTEPELPPPPGDQGWGAPGAPPAPSGPTGAPGATPPPYAPGAHSPGSYGQGSYGQGAYPPGSHVPPTYPPGPGGYPMAGYAPGWGYATAPRTNNLAIAALVCGVCSFVVCPLVAVAGLVTGFQARRQIRESNGAETGDGLAIAGLIVSGLGLLYLVAVALFVIILLAASSGP